MVVSGMRGTHVIAARKAVAADVSVSAHRADHISVQQVTRVHVLDGLEVLVQNVTLVHLQRGKDDAEGTGGECSKRM